MSDLLAQSSGIRRPPSPESVLRQFKDSTVLHPTLRQARDQILEMIDEPGGSVIFLVFGPTGVGKSTLIDAVTRSFVEAHLDELNDDPQLCPPIVIEAPVALGNHYPWRDFLIRGMEALGEPFAGHKVAVEPPPARLADGGQFRSVDGARRAFEAAVRARRPAAIFIDESSHFANVGIGRRLGHLDFIKSLADATRSVFFLVGTYDLTQLRNLNGQLGRRSWDVHLARYAEGDPAFANVAYTFARDVGMDSDEMLALLPFLYERSCGCVGILKLWFVRALSRALRQNCPISTADLQSTAMPGQAARQIAAEIANGERALEETPEIIEELRANLGMEARMSPTPPRRPAGPRRVGKRSPSRDAVPHR
jgi:hypothetical protein